MSEIEKLVIFKTPKELEETKKELEENFNFRFSTQLRRMKLGLDMGARRAKMLRLHTYCAICKT